MEKKVSYKKSIGYLFSGYEFLNEKKNRDNGVRMRSCL